MQAQWQHIMYDQEVPPPDGTWDAIVQVLDDEPGQLSWAQQVYQQESTPPAAVWQALTEHLDRDILAGKWAAQVYQQETVPPAAAWNAIVQVLDNESGQLSWAQQVYQQESTPPAAVWQALTEHLDRDVLAGKWAAQVYQQEAVPPAAAWAAIAQKLQEAPASNWQTAIYNQETAPPAAVWQHIAEALDDNTGAKVISIKSNKRIYIRIAAAAAVIAIVSTLVFRMARTDFSGPVSQPVAVIQPVPPSQEPVVVAPTVQQPTADEQPAAEAIAATTTDNSTTASKRTRAAVTPSPIHSGGPVAQLEFLPADRRSALPDAPAVLTNTQKLPDESGGIATDIARMDAPAGNYIAISGPDGQSVRLSAKMASLIGYLDNGTNKQERLDIIIKESALWKATFREWREKMNQGLTAPSLLNLMDVIELNKLLKSGQ